MNNKIPEEVFFDIEMQSYMRYNDTIASMYDWLGELYSYQDIKEVEQAQEDFEEQLKEDYLNGKLVYTEEDLEKIRESWNINGED
jgi:hypothetical protein